MQYYIPSINIVRKCIEFIYFSVLCQNGDIRLVNGTTTFDGRVEICWNETWGTICDGFWSGFDAQVACRQLGYSTTGMYIKSAL